MSDYEPVIGIEIHARINTQTKMFCRCSNNIFNSKPNSHVCPICMGFPGMLPATNQEAIKKGIKAALALGCTIKEFSKFDRKSYFYPDLPKGFQISQYDQPISEHGKVTITFPDGTTKDIGVTRLHLEDDAGKLTHTSGGTLVDLNRSGTPLMEIVSEPDMRSTEEASLYARQIQKIVRYVDASDADMEKGQMRFDINVSLRSKGQEKFGTRAEVKNLNSFRSLEKALDYEIKRQTELLQSGKEVVQETRGWDDNKEITVSQRGKEEAADYRYFPEPDIPPIVIKKEEIEELRSELPELPDVKFKKYVEMGLSDQQARDISGDIKLMKWFDEAIEISGVPRKTANWLLSELKTLMWSKNYAVDPIRIGKMIKMIEDGEITGKIAKDQLLPFCSTARDPEDFFKPFKVMSDTDELKKICQEVIDRNPQIVADYKGGKEKAIGGLVGQIMGATKGSANPQMVNEILRKLLA